MSKVLSSLLSLLISADDPLACNDAILLRRMNVGVLQLTRTV